MQRLLDDLGENPPIIWCVSSVVSPNTINNKMLYT